MSQGLTRRDSLKTAIAAFCAAPIAKLRAENGGHINATRLSDLVACEDIDSEFEAALPAAERLARKVIASYGALSNADGFYKASSAFAQEIFGHRDALERLHAAIDAVRPYLPEDKAFGLGDAIDTAAGDLETSRWQAMWLLGVCVGVRLGGGRS
jgi:hypothetical protein